MVTLLLFPFEKKIVGDRKSIKDLFSLLLNLKLDWKSILALL